MGVQEGKHIDVHVQQTEQDMLCFTLCMGKP